MSSSKLCIFTYALTGNQCSSYVCGLNTNYISNIDKGSKNYCEHHKILEPWWPMCELCNNSKVAHYKTAKKLNMCHACTNNVYKDNKNNKDNKVIKDIKDINENKEDTHMDSNLLNTPVVSVWKPNSSPKPIVSSWKINPITTPKSIIDDIIIDDPKMISIDQEEKELELKMKELATKKIMRANELKEKKAQDQSILYKWNKMISDAKTLDDKKNILSQLLLL